MANFDNMETILDDLIYSVDLQIHFIDYKNRNETHWFDDITLIRKTWSEIKKLIKYLWIKYFQVSKRPKKPSYYDKIYSRELPYIDCVILYIYVW